MEQAPLFVQRPCKYYQKLFSGQPPFELSGWEEQSLIVENSQLFVPASFTGRPSMHACSLEFVGPQDDGLISLASVWAECRIRSNVLKVISYTPSIIAVGTSHGEGSNDLSLQMLQLSQNSMPQPQGIFRQKDKGKGIGRNQVSWADLMLDQGGVHFHGKLCHINLAWCNEWKLPEGVATSENVF